MFLLSSIHYIHFNPHPFKSFFAFCLKWKKKKLSHPVKTIFCNNQARDQNNSWQQCLKEPNAVTTYQQTDKIMLCACLSPEERFQVKVWTKTRSCILPALLCMRSEQQQLQVRPFQLTLGRREKKQIPSPKPGKLVSVRCFLFVTFYS